MTVEVAGSNPAERTTSPLNTLRHPEESCLIATQHGTHDSIDFNSINFCKELRRYGESVTFASKSEAACAILLEKYCSWFKAIPGQTFQIEIGDKQIDFKLGNWFVEYHPIAIDRDFINFEALQEIRGALRSAPKPVKLQVYRAIEGELEYQYFKQRKNLIDGSEQYRGHGLIVCVSEMAFVQKVLRKFADCRMPDDQQLERMFKRVKKDFAL